MKQSIVTIVFMLLCNTVFAQEPEWYRSTPVSPRADSNLRYATGMGVGDTQKEAEQRAVLDAIVKDSHEYGVTIAAQSLSDLNMNGLDVTIPGSKVRRRIEYVNKPVYNPNRNEYTVYVLLKVQKMSTGVNDFDKEIFTDTYDFSPSIFVPGLAQIYKGSTTKGVCFIAGEIALVGGVVVTQSLKASYESKVSTTHNAKDKLDYITKSDNMSNISNVLIAGAAALYVWNVIDGIAAKGKKHVSVLSSNNLKITPFAAPDLSGGAVGGLALSFNF